MGFNLTKKKKHLGTKRLMIINKYFEIRPEGRRFNPDQESSILFHRPKKNYNELKKICTLLVYERKLKINNIRAVHKNRK